MNIKYVFPHCEKYEDKIKGIKGIKRLFAYPKIPHFENQGDLVILDSGAYGLSLQNRKMNFNHMSKLSEHYFEYANFRDDILCIAPDEFLNPMQSMYNFRKWIKLGFYNKITAVLQCSNMYKVDLKEIENQIEFYNKYTDTFCFSNNGLTAKLAKAQDIEYIFKLLKEKYKVKWIHILGAGWSLEDIKEWLSIKYFDSLDSIAYYNTKNANEFGSLNAVENIHNILKIFGKKEEENVH